MKKTRMLWRAGTAVIGLGILLAAWFLVLTPLQDATERASREAESVEAANGDRRAESAGLAAEAENLPALEADLATLRRQFPSQLELPSFVQRLADLAWRSGAVVHSVSRSEPARADDGADDGGGGGAAERLYRVTVTLEVEGTAEQRLQYLSDLQSIDDRLLLVTGFDGLGVERGTITGVTFVLLGGAAEAAAPDPDPGTTGTDIDLAEGAAGPGGEDAP